MSSLKDIAKRQHMIARVRSTGGTQEATQQRSYCAMVVDGATLRILSACCKVYDILEEGITVVEDIAKKRQPLPELDAIYFISPEEESVEHLCRDFENEKLPQYKTAHVFFSLPLGQKSPIFERIGRAPNLVARLRSFVEFNLGFIAYERRVFHFHSSYGLSTLFPSPQVELTQRLSDELLTFCLSIGDRPNIRFHSNNFRLNEQLASLLHQKLLRVEIPGLSRGRTTLIIVDRSIDTAPLSLHEYTYQAYIYDLLDVPVCSSSLEEQRRRAADEGAFCPDDTVEYPVATAGGKHERRLALLSEQDEVFVRYRHQHLMVALKKIPEEIKSFLNENAAAKLRKRQDMSNEEMQKAIRDLPEYQEMLAKFSAHHSITQRCFAEFNRQGLNKIGNLEQDLATGVDANGKEISVKKCLAALGALLPDPALGIEEKTRLLMLYFSMIDGVRDDDRRKMIEAAQLPLETSMCVQSFVRLGLNRATADMSAPQPTSHIHRFHGDKERLGFFSHRAKSTDIALSRFQPYLKEVMERAVQGTLHAGKFPYVAEPDSKRGRYDSLAGPRSAGASVRARNKDWDFGNTTDDETNDSESHGKLYDDGGSRRVNVLTLPDTGTQTITIFVLGGVTFSETRSAYEVSRQLGCDVFIGGSTILTPRKILQSLKDDNGAPQAFNIA